MFELANLPPVVIRRLNGLWQRRWLILALTWISAIVGWLAIALLPSQYESRAQVFVQTETILQPVLNGVAVRPNYVNRVEVMRLQLLARPNVEEVIYRSGLHQTIEADTAHERAAKMETLIGELSEDIKIASPREMYFIITYRHKEPQIARDVTAAVLNLLIEQDVGASLSESEAARRRLDLQIEEFEERLSANERAVAAFRSENAVELANSESASRRREMKEQELVRVSDELLRTRGRAISLKNILSTTPRIAVGGEMEKLQARLADLKSRYNDTYPEIANVEERIRELQSANDGLMATNPEYIRLQSELAVAEQTSIALAAREEDVRRDLSALELAFAAAPAVLADLQQIERQYETTKKTYEELLARRDRLQLTQNLGPAGRGVAYQVFERPAPAIHPVSPPRLLLIVGVLVIAGGIGLGGGLVLSLLDKSYTQVSELSEAFGLPVLGAVSSAPSFAGLNAQRKDLTRLGAATAALLVVCFAVSYVSVFHTQPGKADTATNGGTKMERGEWG